MNLHPTAIHFAISYFATGFLLLLLALLVYRNNPKRLLNKTFSLYSLTIAWWSLWSIPLVTSSSQSSALLWDRICLVGTIFIPPTFLLFVLTFLHLNKRYSTLLKTCFCVSLAFLVFNVAFNNFVKSVSPRPGVLYFTDPGIVYTAFVIYFSSLSTWGVYLLFKTWRKAPAGTPLERQLAFLFWTSLVGYFGGSLNYSLVFGMAPTVLAILGNYAVAIYAMMVAYIIMRYQFLDIEVLIRRTVVFAGLVASVLGAVSLMAFVSQDLLGRYIGISRAWSNVFAAVLIAALYGRIRDWLVNATDRYLFQKKYDYRDLLKKLTDEVMTVLDLRKLVELTTQALSETIKLDSCALVLPLRGTNRYEVTAAVGKVDRGVTLEETHPLVKYLQQTQEPLARDPARKEQGKNLQALEEALARLGAEVCLPLVVRDDLVGILALGHKKSDEPYAKEDLDILMTLAKTLGIAISNALLAAEAAQKEKLAVIGTLAAAINHEVCNPLNNIKVQAEGFLLQLQRGLLSQLSRQEMEAKVTQIMQTTMSEIDRTAAITTRLSNFAKPAREPVTEPVDLRKVVEEVFSLLGHDLDLREIAVERAIPQDIPRLLVDHRQLQEILFNLVRNAGQAIGQKGRVTIRASRNGDSRVNVEIADTGPGIAPEILQRLFTPFFTTKGEGKGTGLGLFVIKRLVERNEGTIAVDSTVGVGTTFRLEFPTAAVGTGSKQAAA